MPLDSVLLRSFRWCSSGWEIPGLVVIPFLSGAFSQAAEPTPVNDFDVRPVIFEVPRSPVGFGSLSFVSRTLSD